MDIAVAALLLLSTAAGYFAGLIRSVYRVFSFAVSAALTWLCYPVISRALSSVPAARGFIAARVSEFVAGAEEKYGASAAHAIAGGASAQRDYIQGLRLPSLITRQLVNNNNPQTYDAFNITNFQDYIVDGLSKMIFNAIAIALAFICVMIIMALISGTLNSISRIPIIRPINTALGALYGAGRAVVIIWVVFAAVSLLLLKSDAGLKAAIDQSSIARLFSDYNPVMHWISDLGVHHP